MTSVYREVWLAANLADDRRVQGVAYVVDRAHPQYAGRLPLADVLPLIAQGRGISGTNVDYVRATHEHLLGEGILDPTLSFVLQNLPLAQVR